MRAALLAVALALSASGSAHAQADAPGEITVVARAGHAPRVRVSGYADLEQHIAMPRDAVFRIASLTKQFTAVAVLALVEDGRLALDDTLAQRLPDCPPAWREITLRQLLSHTSGISGDFRPLFAHAQEDMTPRALVALYADMPLHAAPGAHWEYANANYWILGLVIENVTGQSYSAFVGARVLAPAHLTHTRIGDWADIVPNRIRGYERTPEAAYHNARYFSATLGYAAGGYVSSAQDMAHWYEALSQGRIISRQTIALALTPTRLSTGETAPYGLGWYVTTIDGHVVAHHGGSTIGYRAYLYWRPDTGAFAGVFINSSGEEEPKDEARALFQRGR